MMGTTLNGIVHVPSTQDQLLLHLLGITTIVSRGTLEHMITVHINDPLWDGESCGTDNNSCAQPGMP